ncbi:MULTISPECIES: LVIVD repeat-containing protein [unclassified Cellulophaga]|uniref:LVIVD repeat-containing protein n=1 Tax=unclassified Cellulophaga TaxID=2634405 RepID=UPI0026E31D45|nr:MULTISPECIES: hypothetical protein [unclassified Cellulophaga]MDO6491872.1 hypothetical protein [Cellulophaga sp. 2_MG-2023]MDO6495473.1 hypothetical protein [Cellulophaga sp. 3_MG-2023]
MKNHFILLLALAAVFISCTDDVDDSKYADFLVAKPLKISLSEFESSGSIVAPKPIEESGKIYAYNNYIFINDKYKGVHVIDNKNPEQPNKIAFISIIGNVDISVKDNYLYADSLGDLLVFDISNKDNIKLVNRLKNVLRDNIVWPAADIYDWENVGAADEILVGWEVVTERRLKKEVNVWFENGTLNNTTDAGNVGQGGSLARFKIVADYLYAVDNHSINVFDIQDLENPKDLEDIYAGFDIETIFNKGNHLFLGSRSGMYIYDISTPQTPAFVSEFQHGTACDPVVVDGNYAYVTLRGGNTCGATESGLYIIDISTIADPVLAKQYPLDGPYGLGIKGDELFICDGNSGLKVYDKTDVNNLKEVNHFKDIVTFDVIPREENLLMVGDNVLYQYKYLENNISLLSSLHLD